MAVIYEWDDPNRLEDLDLGDDCGEDRSLVLCCHEEVMVVLFVVTTEPEPHA
jgi:hypothetical protein